MLKLLHCILVAGGIALAWGFVDGPAAASETGDVTVGDLEDLVAAIEDDAEREELVGRLNTLIELKKGEEGVLEPGQQTLGAIVIEQLSAHSEALGRQLSALTDAVIAIPGGLANLREDLSDPATFARWTEAFWR